MSKNNQPQISDLPKSPGTRIVKAADVAHWVEGYRFLDTAKDVYKAEAERGYADGKAQGMSEAMALTAQTAAKTDVYLRSLEPQIASLVISILRKILGEFDTTDLVARTTLQALIAFRSEKALTITVHPRNEAYLAQALAAYFAREGADFAYKIETDPASALDACVITTDGSIFDASIEAQLQTFADALNVASRVQTK